MATSSNSRIVIIFVALAFLAITVIPAYAMSGTETLSLRGLIDWFFNLFKEPIEIATKPYCAEKFDEMVEYYYDNIKDKSGSIDKIMKDFREIGTGFGDNRCAWSVNDWAESSDYPGEVRKFDWEWLKQSVYDFENPKTPEQIQQEENTVGTEAWSRAQYTETSQWYKDKDCEKLLQRYQEINQLQNDVLNKDRADGNNMLNPETYKVIHRTSSIRDYVSNLGCQN